MAVRSDADLTRLPTSKMSSHQAYDCFDMTRGRCIANLGSQSALGFICPQVVDDLFSQLVNVAFQCMMVDEQLHNLGYCLSYQASVRLMPLFSV